MGRAEISRRIVALGLLLGCLLAIVAIIGVGFQSGWLSLFVDTDAKYVDAIREAEQRAILRQRDGRWRTTVPSIARKADANWLVTNPTLSIWRECFASAGNSRAEVSGLYPGWTITIAPDRWRPAPPGGVREGDLKVTCMAKF